MKKEPLDILFKNLSSPPSSEEDHWDEFEIRLQKKMFYKFSWNRFNIYYAALISLSVLTNIILLVALLTMPSSPYTSVEQKQLLSSDTTVATLHLSPDESNAEKSFSKGSQAEKTLPITTRNDSVLTVTGQTNKDTVPAATAEKNSIIPALVPTSAPIVVKRKSTMYISKRDTIINIDTVKVKRKK